MCPRTPGVNVRLAKRRISCLASSASAMRTPASAYRMGVWSLSIQDSGRSKLDNHDANQMLSEWLEYTFPTDHARIHKRVRIGEKTLTNLPGVPGVSRRFHRHVNKHRRADNCGARHESPVATIVGVVAIVSHNEIIFRRYLEGAKMLIRVHRLQDIGFALALTIDPHRTLFNFDGIAGHADNPLYQVGVIG